MLIMVYKKVWAAGYTGTDDALLAERFGIQVKIISRGRKNIEITYPLNSEITKLTLKKRTNE